MNYAMPSLQAPPVEQEEEDLRLSIGMNDNNEGMPPVYR